VFWAPLYAVTGYDPGNRVRKVKENLFTPIGLYSVMATVVVVVVFVVVVVLVNINNTNCTRSTQGVKYWRKHVGLRVFSVILSAQYLAVVSVVSLLS